MATREPLSTDRALIGLARSIVFRPQRSRAVFYHGEDGAWMAEDFVRRSVSHTRIDELLARSDAGTELRQMLGARPWAETAEVWWELSRKLARAASGDVQCFGSSRLTDPQPLSTHRSRFSKRHYVDTVFEKVELPELENNQGVDTIYYNGKPLI